MSRGEPGTRDPLSRERVVEAAVALADQKGIGSVTMRRLARTQGVEAMSLYHYVANKDDLMDGMVDLVFAEIGPPDADTDWRTAMRRRAVSARETFARHLWAIGLLDTRSSPGPSTLRHHEAMTGCLRRGGFSVAATAHAYALLDSYNYGFAIQEASLPFEGPEGAAAIAEAMLERMPADEFPYLVEMATEHVLQPGYDFGEEFEFGLELILDGLDRVRHGR